MARGAELVSTGGTARALAEAGLSVTAVSDVTGFPVMLDGRVKTLHPAVHGGILARRGRPDDLEAIRGQGIQPIDLVVVNLYPFALTAASEATFEELIEQIDIGGPSMVRAAAKSFADVLVVVDPADYGRVVEALDGAGGPDRKLRFELARKAFAHTAAYDATIAAALDAVDTGGPAFARAPFTLSGVVPDQLSVQAPKVRELRYGENPHQRAALYTDGAWGFGAGARAAGQGAVVHEPARSRRGGPAGDGVQRAGGGGPQAHQSVRRGERAEPARGLREGAGGGRAVGVRRHRGAQPAARRGDGQRHRRDVHGVRRGARGQRRGAQHPGPQDEPAPGRRRFRRRGRCCAARRAVHPGAWLVQQRDHVVEAADAWDDGLTVAPDTRLRVVTKRQPTDEEWMALRFAWRVCAHVKSNTVIFAHADRLAAVGAGQMSRVDAVRIAVLKAAGDLAGTVAASDAFFPFRDGLDAIAMAGATAVVQPGGSKRDAEVIAAADQHGMAMVFAGRRHFRH